MDDGGSKTLLLGFIRRVKALADEIGDLQADVSDVCKEAKDAGFEAVRIREVVRWLRKIEKHGRDKVDEAEAIFDLYRQVADGGTGKLDELMDEARDKALVAMFVPDADAGLEEKLSARRKAAAKAVAIAQLARGAGQ